MDVDRRSGGGSNSGDSCSVSPKCLLAQDVNNRLGAADHFSITASADRKETGEHPLDVEPKRRATGPAVGIFGAIVASCVSPDDFIRGDVNLLETAVFRRAAAP